MLARILEYLTLGKPVIASRATGISDYFDGHALHPRSLPMDTFGWCGLAQARNRR
jgi:hypothetical protein